MGLLSKLSPKRLAQEAKRAAAGAERTVTRAAAKVESSAGKKLAAMKDAARPKTAAAAALLHDGLETLKDKALDHLPPEYLAQPKMPDYTPLPSRALADAKRRGAGKSVEAPCIQGPKGGTFEPVSLEVAGTREQLEAALARAGWVKAEKTSRGAQLRTDLSLLAAGTGASKLVDFNEKSSPVSPMLLHGKAQALSFEKNNDHHQCRDHIRIYPSGKVDAQGRPIWQIAATRDISYRLDLRDFHASHQIDHAIDGERNMLMADLLGAGSVKSWYAADGKRSAADEAHVRSRYQTDGDCFVVSLKG